MAFNGLRLLMYNPFHVLSFFNNLFLFSYFRALTSIVPSLGSDEEVVLYCKYFKGSYSGVGYFHNPGSYCHALNCKYLLTYAIKCIKK